MHYSNKKRLRFAPSPTGHFHLGHVLSMAFVFGFAEMIDAEVHLRIEDHDRQRCREEHIHSMLYDMEWLGFLPVNWDNVQTKGKEASYRQSFRPERYEEALKTLAQKGLVYRCRCSRQEITARSAHSAQNEELYYDGHCKNAAHEEGMARFRLSHEAVTFEDLWAGRCTQTPSVQCGDMLLVDRFGQFTYNFSVVVDDIYEGIDCIVRGKDILHCTGRQLLLADALGSSTMPLFLHHPLLVDQEGKKLSKRFYSTGLAPLREEGLTPAKILGMAFYHAGLIDRESSIDRACIPAYIESTIKKKRDYGYEDKR